MTNGVITEKMVVNREHEIDPKVLDNAIVAFEGAAARFGKDAIKDANARASYYVDPKTGKPPKNYENQCAIKVSVTLHKVGVLIKSYKHNDKIRINGLNTAVLAENLASWLKLVPFCGLPKEPENITGSNWQEKINGKTGIVFFKDYWARTGSESNPTGDHIDLWNGSRLTSSGFLGALTTFARFTLGVASGPGFSDLGKAKEILFGEIK